MIRNSELEIRNCDSIYAFILDRETKIALCELESVLRRFGICFDILSLLENIVVIKSDFPKNCKLSPETLISQLGGTIKIFEILNIQYPISNKISNIQHSIIDLLTQPTANSQRPTGTLNFGISDYSGEYNAKQLSEIGIKIKIQARKKRPVRFIANKKAILSSATSFHKIFKTGGEEYGIFKNPKFKTQNQKNIKCHSERICRFGRGVEESYHHVSGSTDNTVDSSVPQNDYLNRIENSDINHSMKIAVPAGRQENCSKGSEFSEEKIENLNDIIVYDPFCGSGNILMEARMLGCEIMGSDLSEKAVEDTKANLEWLSSQPLAVSRQPENLPTANRQPPTEIFQADASSFDFTKKLQTKKLIPDTCNLIIVTEPYLGRPKKVKVERKKLKGEAEELKNLYLGFFNNLKLLAASYSLLAVIFVFPIISTSDAGEISIYEECVDEIVKMGYNPQCTLRYGRDYQVVKRQIVVMSLQKSEARNTKYETNN